MCYYVPECFQGHRFHLWNGWARNFQDPFLLTAWNKFDLISIFLLYRRTISTKSHKFVLHLAAPLLLHFPVHLVLFFKRFHVLQQAALDLRCFHLCPGACSTMLSALCPLRFQTLLNLTCALKIRRKHVLTYLSLVTNIDVTFQLFTVFTHLWKKIFQT